MNQTARIISIYAADTSGFCSALYEYGGMTVIHDASGCNSTYTTHDEPRWYDKDTMMYISGFTEQDAIMGNDERFVHDLCLAANELKPEFVAICASPLPAMTGVDLDAIAYEVEASTGIPSFAVKTNGMQSYITGAANAFTDLAMHFTEDMPRLDRAINLLGVTPLDFPLKGTTDAFRKWLSEYNFTLNANIGMDTNLDQIRSLSRAQASLVVSSSGLSLARYLYSEYQIPYVIGCPFGRKLASIIAKDLEIAIEENINIESAKNNRVYGEEIAIVGESILSTSLAASLSLEYKTKVRVLESVGDGDMTQLIQGDVSCDDEDILEKELTKSKTVIGDPLFQPICKNQKFIRLPHPAFSGRCFSAEDKIWINNDLFEI
ncbi:MAG: nitrogenase component 1 [Eubacterium sp.]|nr:nitrogenase component 1 [Eubacterium sp.]